MAFTDRQEDLLRAPLDRNRVATRSQGGMNLSYLEGYDVMDYANKVFGFEAWNYTVTKLEEVSKITNQKGNHVVSYIALVKVICKAGDDVISREDVGYGSGISKQLGDAYEGATKEAVTDAFKRAMRGFGNGFGLALYDKEQRNVKSLTAEETIERVQKIDPKAEVQVTNYKNAVAEVMQAQGVNQDDIPDCAKFIINSGLDIKDNPRAIYTERKDELIKAVNLYIEASEAV